MKIKMHMNEIVQRIVHAVHQDGGEAYYVGGYVRDELLGRESSDLDVEIRGLSADHVDRLLRRYTDVKLVGQNFGVFDLVDVPDCQVSLARRDSQVGPGHADVVVKTDENISLAEAASRRDLTVNAIYRNAITGELLDPVGGLQHLREGILHPVSEHFGEDPLRAIRAFRFAAQLEMRFSDELDRVVRQQDLSRLAQERYGKEFRKLLLNSRRPSVALQLLYDTGISRFIPEIHALKDVPQEFEWHPEGPVCRHTMMVVDEAAGRRHAFESDEDRLLLMWSALAHDFGKPIVTEFDAERNQIRSPGHDEAGVEPARQMMLRFGYGQEFADRVGRLVLTHLMPSMLPAAGSSKSAYRRLRRKLEEFGLSSEMLAEVAYSDHMGRSTADALARHHPRLQQYREMMEKIGSEPPPIVDVVQGRHLIQRGMKPGKHFGVVLRRCVEIQLETGSQDPDQILAAVLDGQNRLIGQEE